MIRIIFVGMFLGLPLMSMDDGIKNDEIIESVKELHVAVLKQTIHQQDLQIKQQKKLNAFENSINMLIKKVDGLSTEVKWLRWTSLLGLTVFSICLAKQLEYQLSKFIFI